MYLWLQPARSIIITTEVQEVVLISCTVAYSNPLARLSDEISFHVDSYILGCKLRLVLVMLLIPAVSSLVDSADIQLAVLTESELHI